jgi:F-box and WD-40 domain protein CDC4
MDADIRIWDLRTGQCPTVVRGHTSLIGILRLSHGNLISGSADGTVRIVDFETGQLKEIVDPSLGAITAVHSDAFKVVFLSDSSIHIHTLPGRSVGDGGTVSAHTNQSRKLTPPGMYNGAWAILASGRWCLASVSKASGTFVEVWDFSKERDPVDQWMGEVDYCSDLWCEDFPTHDFYASKPDRSSMTL